MTGVGDRDASPAVLGARGGFMEGGYLFEILKYGWELTGEGEEILQAV